MYKGYVDKEGCVWGSIHSSKLYYLLIQASLITRFFKYKSTDFVGASFSLIAKFLF